MKSVYFLITIGIFSTLMGCKQFKADHPQAGLGDEHATDLTAKSILHYADSIDKSLNVLEKTTSLVYMLGDLSFYVEKYSLHNKPILMVEHAFNGGISNNLKKYYLRNDSLIFETMNNQLSNEDGNVFKQSRTYLRNNTIFRIEDRSASAETEIKSLPFVNLPLSQNNTTDQSHLEDVKTLADMINGTDKFDMVFESITTYPDSRYIVLRSRLQNNYTASILVNQKDAFIDSLLNKPIDFKDQKLKINWVIKDQEAVYVPVANNTSANGLKR
ncbi:hypothetical protein [Pedobacter sp. UC225_65]|uniref:hypothetical protein n=1 Tax=Pedobacter sp. UC225_65 TaxID=3350173 RepID=UPI00367012EE